MVISREDFVKYAFLFYNNADKIKEDPKLFYIPIKTHNGLAYTGDSGFNDACIGTYLTFWESDNDFIYDEKEKLGLIFHISGSPLSGANACTRIYENDGEVRNPTNKFSKTWHAFYKINKDIHADMPADIIPYSLEDALNILQYK